MQSLFKAFLLVLSFSASSFASEMTTVEGTVSFDQGQYFVQGKDMRTALSGMDMAQLRAYEGKAVKVAGEQKVQSLDVYKIFVKKGDAYEASYDWEVVNQDLYSN